MSLAYKELSNGQKMPTIGLGTWKSKPGEVKAAVKYAILEAGYRHIDCALIYQNEHEIGAALKEIFASGAVKREDLFITSKCWNTYHSRDNVKVCCKASLDNLCIDYIDLYLIHWPFGFKEDGELFPRGSDGKPIYSQVDYLETWKGMEDCLNEKLVKSIGISNFNSHQIDRLIANCTIKPAVNQVEIHPYFNQKKLIDFCNQRGITVTAYSPLGSPDRPGSIPNEPGPLDDPVIIKVAQAKNKSPAQVILRFMVQQGLVVIPKSVTLARIKQNIEIFDFDLSKDDMSAINGLNKDKRFIAFANITDHPHYPFSVPF